MENQPNSCICDDIRPEYRFDLKNKHSGFSETDPNFQNHYNLALHDINLECLRCCLLYLEQRMYTIAFGKLDFVSYPILPIQPGTPMITPRISAFLKIPKGGGKKGQIATGNDLNLGKPSIRAFEHSRTYQMYSPTGTLSVGFNAQVRMESVAIDVVKRHELDDIQVNYAHAVLIEKYRESCEKDTLLGCCSIRLPLLPIDE
ncbi:Hypothetical predicted protein [Mytilus galloprovincialis]|uniref:Uncharacterized protein n=1 Tax=Mytilus galloprovincialis TaxID=29158 RepID=A0A8B6FLA8_MYTGA|nr:Hypothetical predicted protein [Mytilus galloprovincialis]